MKRQLANTICGLKFTMDENNLERLKSSSGKKRNDFVIAVTNLKNLAKLANKIAETFQFSDSSVAAIDPGNSNALEAKIDLLTTRLAALESEHELNPTRQSRGRGRNRSTSDNLRASSRSRSASGRCWYHQRYHKKARKCTKPCS